MRILLTGANGQVGTEFRKIGSASGELTAAGRAECDLTHPDALREFVRAVQPDVIVNAAAYTAVDLAEKERDLCFAVNATAPGVLAEEAARLGALLIHYSTDYVFDGSQAAPYTEEDRTAPLGVYGESKRAGEEAIAAAGARALVLRTSWVYSTHGRNFLLTMLRLAKERPELRVVADQFGAPTSAAAIARATSELIRRHSEQALAGGLYHMTGAGSTSWHGFASAIVERSGLPAKVTPISTAEYPTPARRPRNSVLNNDKFARAFGFRLAPWGEELDRVLKEWMRP